MSRTSASHKLAVCGRGPDKVESLLVQHSHGLIRVISIRSSKKWEIGNISHLYIRCDITAQTSGKHLFSSSPVGETQTRFPS